MLKTWFLIAVSSVFMLLVPAVKAQSLEPFSVNTGNDLLRNLQTCEALGKADGHSPLNVVVCMRTTGFVEGASAAFNATEAPDSPNSIGAIAIPSGVLMAQVVAVVRRYLENHPEIRNQPSLGLIYVSLVEAWPGPNAPKLKSQGSGTKPTIDKQTCAKIAAQPDPFAQFGGISNDNAICKEAYPDLYQPHR